MNRALFPLNSVVLPGGRLPLRLFERRYMDMLTHSLRAREPFVLVLLEQGGSDTRADVAFHPIGCEVSVVDFSPLENGFLGITVEGLSKVSVARNWRETDGLNRGDVVVLPEEPRTPTPLRHEDLSELLAALCRHPSVAELDLSIDYDDARQVGWRLTELLPMVTEQRQSLVEMDDPLERLEILSRLVEDME
ncbi:LON peptidase substrate-binding domain-containing protein [Vreelandella utahensis]|uniref:LON peptidase substrate-binding domain-containing protein n=1 Tax=Vreelandella halophila TaxID=86177 RepID=UPI000985F8E6|nr:LON peptidase substrate-binding domain-containing protein [Halomonas utahensis]